MKWDLTGSERTALRSMFGSKGWEIWDDAMKELEDDCVEEVASVEDERSWRVAKGHLAMVRRVRGLAGDLVSVSEQGREEWVRKKMLETQAEMEEMQDLLLSRDKDRRGAKVTRA